MINWPQALDDWLTSPHEFGHLLGFKKLTKSHDNWINIFLHAKGLDALQAHRGSYKTTCGIVALTLLFMIKPELRVLITRKTITMASDVIKSVQKIFESNGAVLLYMKSRWNIDSAKTDCWSAEKTNFAFKRNVTVQASLTAAGVGGSITGAHFDYIWADDIVTVEDRYSAAERRATKSYWNELINVIEPSGARMLTSTPWHEDDLHSILPKDLYKDRVFPFGTVDLPEEDMADIAARKSVLPVSEWCANYELRHVDDRDTLGVFPTVDTWDCDYSVAFIDSSFSDRTDTDSTATAIVGVRSNGDLVFTGLKSPRSIADYATRKEIILFLDRFKPVETVFESQLADATVFLIMPFREMESELRLSVKNYWTVKRQTRNKHERISATIAAHRDRIKMLTGTQPEYALGVARYSKNAEHDDEADALAGAIEALGTSEIIAEYARALGIIQGARR